ncbi:hypothetical protein [Epilithonimonas mollis]|uniref:Uncharacterized protein n=1 Tax=Epilithonimonas mollis TaxID=216903 RepID=A0A1M6PU60_9FLAO|nr:hypothetical protein [Epilithonimonas mollis]SHK11514.1 hypothetical protein SAMN05444371_1319 [Epilithonimonas mollis]
MKNVITSSVFILIFLTSFVKAQKISDGETLDLNGLSVTFNVLNKETISAGGKNLDRYKVSATLTNNSQKSYNMRMSNAPQIATNTVLVELNCINATGAKLTSKKLDLKLKAQTVNVTYWAYTKDGKYESTVMPIIASYYLDTGESVNDTAIFIVPQGEALNVTARKLQ